MIRYALRCRAGHDFESWFRSAGDFEGLKAAGHVACPACGSSDVDKALMAPQVRPARRAAAVTPATTTESPPPERPLTTPQTPHEKALAELRRRIEERSDYVGLSFAAEARRMHAGEVPERAIHGEAHVEEAKALLAEGVPVAPLPFLPARKAN